MPWSIGRLHATCHFLCVFVSSVFSLPFPSLCVCVCGHGLVLVHWGEVGCFLPSGLHTHGVNHTPAPGDLFGLFYKEAAGSQSLLDCCMKTVKLSSNVCRVWYEECFWPASPCAKVYLETAARRAVSRLKWRFQERPALHSCINLSELCFNLHCKQMHRCLESCIWFLLRLRFPWWFIQINDIFLWPKHVLGQNVSIALMRCPC